MEKTVANRIAFAQTRDLLLEGQNVRICVQGQSMLPFFRSGSVITLRSSRTWINPTGNAMLATAGSGDVLSGMLGAFFAQGYDLSLIHISEPTRP